MLKDEEKEALEILKGFEPDDLVECAIYLQALEKITNLIEKQSKEIEELKEKFSETYEYFKRDFTPNDEIKAKIEEVKDGTFDAKIVLQSLLDKE